MTEQIESKNSLLRHRFVKILLITLLLYLVTEGMRFYVISSTVAAASGAAVRYASATGIGLNGVPRFQDCQGIKDAAQSMNNRNAFNVSDITISYDRGPDTSIFDTCDGVVDTNVNPINGDRVVVSIKTDFRPIIPIFKPFLSRTSANGNPIISKSTRTILTTVAIESTPAATPNVPPVPISTSIILPTPWLYPVTGGDPFEEIDTLLNQSISASIAYNVPTEMEVGETVTIELLLNPRLSEPELLKEITEPGIVWSGGAEITPQMKAVVIVPTKNAFLITPLHDDPVQFISGVETTKWSWYVTAQKAGTQRLTIVVYRLVKVDGEESWREVETYKSDIDVKVTLVNQIKSLDWKWIIGIIVTALLIPGFWRWIDARNKNKAQNDNREKPISRKSARKKIS